MHRADKAVLRLAVGMAIAVLIAYGFALRLPFVVCVVTLLLLCKPGPPLPFVKGLVVAGVVGSLLLAGVLMVPLLENYRAGRRRADGGRCSTPCTSRARSPPIR